MKYYTVGQFAKIISKTPQTIRNWDKENILKPHHVSESGYRYYSDEQVNHYLGFKGEKPVNRKVIGYCRVSSNKQKDDLERQIENMQTYLLAGGKPFEIITDIGSGINYKKKGLLKIIELITQNKIEKIVVLYKDRLLRFGAELVFSICEAKDVEVIIINKGDENPKFEEELAKDVLEIITVFSARLYGDRSKKNKKLLDDMNKVVSENVSE